MFQHLFAFCYKTKAKKKEFPKKHLNVDNKIKKYTPALHFFDSTRNFKKHP
jgi:hypothetical protein